MEELGSQAFNLNIGKRLVIIVVFLSLLWFVLNYVVTRVKSGQWTIPDFLKKSLKVNDKMLTEAHKIELIQRKYLVDGSELLVVDVDGSHVLLARSVNGSISYIKDLEGKG